MRPPADEDLIRSFLNGALAPNSDRERKAREAFVRLLRDYDKPLSRTLRITLAAIFDKPRWYDRPERQRKEPRKKRPDGSAIAIYIYRRTGSLRSNKQVVADAIKHFRVSRAGVMRAWNKHRELAQHYVQSGLPDFDPIPPPRVFNLKWRNMI
jgi:hypothetical protein